MTREEAIKTLQELWRETNDSWYEEAYNMAIEALQVESKTGKWLEKDIFSSSFIDEVQSAMCSECGVYHTTPFIVYFDEYKFCPNCGARMKIE